MTYALQAHIEGELKGIAFDSTSYVTTTKLGQMLEEADAEINGYINGRYTLPVTNADALLFLRKIAIDLIVYRITKVMEIKNARPIPDNRILQDISHGSVYRQAIKTLENIRDGKTQLYGATLKTATGRPTSYNESNNIEPTFKIDEQQW